MKLTMEVLLEQVPVGAPVPVEEWESAVERVESVD